ncbi:MAG TPA: hypothetical protein VFO34_14120 [Candidatus Acidoferrales bacterium]|nr:hypothetical protein [Candidatus Acidoferrales bacterium]
MRIKLNVATRPLENERRFIFGAVVLGTIAVLAFGLLLTRALNVSREARRQRAQLSQLREEIANIDRQRAEMQTFFSGRDIQRVTDRAKFLNNLIDQRSFPWTRIFMDLENVLPEGVRIVTISPKLGNGHIELRLLIGAASDEDRLKFLRTLESSRSFSHVQLLSELHQQRQNDPDKVYLEIIAWYAVS